MNLFRRFSRSSFVGHVNRNGGFGAHYRYG